MPILRPCAERCARIDALGEMPSNLMCVVVGLSNAITMPPKQIEGSPALFVTANDDFNPPLPG